MRDETALRAAFRLRSSCVMSARFVRFLIDRRCLTPGDVIGLLGVEPLFVARVLAANESLSMEQRWRLADAVGEPVGALMLESSGVARARDPKVRKVLDLCRELILLSDKAILALRAERAAKAASKRPA